MLNPEWLEWLMGFPSVGATLSYPMSLSWSRVVRGMLKLLCHAYCAAKILTSLLYN